MNDFGEPLKSRIFIGDALSASCFNFNCSTADGFVVIFLLVAFRRSFLKSFNDVFGVPSRSLHVVVCGLFRVTCDIDVLLPKLLSLTMVFDDISAFLGVDVLNVVFDFDDDFFE